MAYRVRQAQTRIWAPINTSTGIHRRGDRRNRAIDLTPPNHTETGAEVMTRRSFSGAVILSVVAGAGIFGQESRPLQETLGPAAAPAVTLPADYVIGLDDVLTVTFWREQNLSADVVVRPDGKITLPLMNDVEAEGLTPLQLKEKLTAASARFLENPNVTVAVKEIKSRRVFITGRVEKPGVYLLTAPTTVLQLLAMAGGLKEFADGKHILITRMVSGTPTIYTSN